MITQVKTWGTPGEVVKHENRAREYFTGNSFLSP